MEWKPCYQIGFTLSDGQIIGSGNNSFNFPADEKIVRIEVSRRCYDSFTKIIFYGKKGILVQLGDGHREGSLDSFDIGHKEQLIGCELEYANGCLLGITFLKWTNA